MGIEPPFLYDHPSRYSFTSPTEKGFQPKAASQASWSHVASRPKPGGPLISAKELNRHPDSYFVVPYGQLNWKPLSPNTRSRVTNMRLVQLLLRICALLGSAGLLVCVICIKGTDSTLGWIIRISPSIAILHTIYAIHHLVKSSKGRTPASTASYMLFAAIIDAGLIPFLAFTAMVSRAQYIEPVDVEGHWGTLLGDDSDTFKVIYSTFLISIVNGALFLIALCISIYLAVIFRKIAKLPPDMNPLEDNLTSRHKRNKSSISAPVEAHRDFTAPLMESPRTVPFMNTRGDSSNSASPRRSAHVDSAKQTASQRSSRAGDAEQFHLGQQQDAQRPIKAGHSSRIHVGHEQAAAHRSSRVSHLQLRHEQTAVQTSTAGHPSHIHLAHQPPNLQNSSRAARPSSTQPSPAYHLTSIHPPSSIDHFSSNHPTSTSFDDKSPVSKRSTKADLSLQVVRSPYRSSTRQSSSISSTTGPSDDNWVTYKSGTPSPTLAPPQLQYLRASQAVVDLPPAKLNFQNRTPRPLEMNPPTPPILSQQRALMPRSGNAVWQDNQKRPQHIRGDSFGIVGDKSRYYGELHAVKGRVVSSGAKYSDLLGIRAREVSGKVVEEGRGTLVY
ncbi:hypothetical protein MMC13_008397 [Lambiella insularis]|nr:hypothetical protein [Lambiella insularis]